MCATSVALAGSRPFKKFSFVYPSGGGFTPQPRVSRQEQASNMHTHATNPLCPARGGAGGLVDRAKGLSARSLLVTA
jgi:hypothetical protein